MHETCEISGVPFAGAPPSGAPPSGAPYSGAPSTGDRFRADRELVFGRPLSVRNFREVFTVWDTLEQRRLPGEFPSYEAATAYAANLNARHRPKRQLSCAAC